MDSSLTPKDKGKGILEESDNESCEEVEIPFNGTGNTKEIPRASASSSHLPAKIIVTRSVVWDHFTRIEKNDNKCRCHYCGKIMSCYTTSGTSNLKKHLLSCKQHRLWAAKKGKEQVITPDGHLKLAKVSEAVFREASNEMLVMNRLFEEYSCWNASHGSSGSSSHTTATSSQVSQSMSGQEINTGDRFDFDDDIDDFDGYERMDCVYNEMVNEKSLHEAMNELELYLKESVEIPKLLKGTEYVEYDVLGWWRLNTPRFPVLSEIARDVLALQVSVVASESAFSTSGRVLDPYRSCLTHNTLEVLMCTEQWLKCEIRLENGVVTNSDLLADIELQDTLQREFGL